MLVIQVRGAEVVESVMRELGQWSSLNIQRGLAFQRGGMVAFIDRDSLREVYDAIDRIKIAEFPNVVLCEGGLHDAEMKWDLKRAKSALALFVDGAADHTRVRLTKAGVRCRRVGRNQIRDVVLRCVANWNQPDPDDAQ